MKLKKFSLVLIVLSAIGVVFSYMVSFSNPGFFLANVREISFLGLAVGAVLFVIAALWKRRH